MFDLRDDGSSYRQAAVDRLREQVDKFIKPEAHIVATITSTGSEYSGLCARPYSRLDRERETQPNGAITLYAWSDGVVTWTTDRP